MSGLTDLQFVPEHFSGKARLFPLPGRVLFPHVLQPLHIFEPRYCDLLLDAIASDRLIAIAGLLPGWEAQYEGRPPLYPVACLAKITSHQQQPDGRHNVLMLGLRRVQLLRELPATRTFREAEVVVLEDEYPSIGSPTRSARQQALVAIFHRLTPNLELPEPLEKLLASDLPLGALTDLIGYALDLGMEFKQRLLAERDVDRRASLLLDHFRDFPPEAPGKSQVFPPQFSHN